MPWLLNDCSWLAMGRELERLYRCRVRWTLSPTSWRTISSKDKWELSTCICLVAILGVCQKQTGWRAYHVSFIVEAGEHPLKGSIRVQKYPFRVWSGREVVQSWSCFRAELISILNASHCLLKWFWYCQKERDVRYIFITLKLKKPNMKNKDTVNKFERLQYPSTKDGYAESVTPADVKEILHR